MKYTHRHYLPSALFIRSETERWQWQDAVEPRRRPDPSLPQPLSDDEGELQGLRRVQPRVTVSVVAVAQVIESHGA